MRNREPIGGNGEQDAVAAAAVAAWIMPARARKGVRRGSAGGCTMGTPSTVRYISRRPAATAANMHYKTFLHLPIRPRAVENHLIDHAEESLFKF